jgi:hypothetical protein
MNKIARRMADIQPFHVMEILKRAHQLEAAGRDIIHLEVGEPDFPTPPTIVEAAAISWRRPRALHPALGLTALRERSHASTTTASVPTSPRTHHRDAGRSGALMLALAVTTDPGDEWLLPDPATLQPPPGAQLRRRCPALPVDATTRFQPTPAHVADAWTARTRGLMVASPANPTGTLLSQAEIIALHEAVAARGGILIVDEIYQGLNYGVDASTALSQPGRCVRGEQLLEVLRHDRLAPRLGGCAPGLRAPDRKARPALLHLAVDAGPARGPGRLHPATLEFSRNAATPSPRAATRCSRRSVSSAFASRPNPRARSICTPTSRISPTAAKPSHGA